jgi:general secretion pathway protein J
MTRGRGFTLIEILIVLLIFSIIGVISARIVSGVLANERTLSERGARLAEVQRAMQILQRDLLQLSSRGIRDQLGDPLEPMLIGADGMIEFTRLGWRNPLERPRSELQRVGYILQEDTLYRAYWMVLDRAPDSEPQLQTMLSGVEQIEFFGLDASGNEHSFWPPAGDLRDDPNLKLAAVILRLDVEPFGVVERLWPVAVGEVPLFGQRGEPGAEEGSDGELDPGLDSDFEPGADSGSDFGPDSPTDGEP